MGYQGLREKTEGRVIDARYEFERRRHTANTVRRQAREILCSYAAESKPDVANDQAPAHEQAIKLRILFWIAAVFMALFKVIKKCLKAPDSFHDLTLESRLSEVLGDAFIFFERPRQAKVDEKGRFVWRYTLVPVPQSSQWIEHLISVMLDRGWKAQIEVDDLEAPFIVTRYADPKQSLKEALPCLKPEFRKIFEAPYVVWEYADPDN